jgi:heptaprenyl diphosphate synthase/octaprenyl-diphosphate synthase
VAEHVALPASLSAILSYAHLHDDMAAVESLLLQRTNSRSPLIAAASEYTVRAGGKRLRAALALLAGRLGNYSLERVIHPAAAAELIHAASLVHDDLVDKANQRRGRMTVHARWDDDVALMVGDYFFALAAGEMALSPDPRIIAFYAQAVQTIVEGELSPVMQVAPFAEAERQYLYKTGAKTATLFEAACKAGITATQGSPEAIETMGRYGYDLGLAFQIIDDVLDFVGDERTLGKPAGNDLRQGTITLPLIYAVARGGSPLLQQIVHEQPSEAAVQQALAEVLDRGGVAAALADARAYGQRAINHLQHFPASPAKRALIDLTAFVIERQM